MTLQHHCRPIRQRIRPTIGMASADIINIVNQAGQPNVSDETLTRLGDRADSCVSILTIVPALNQADLLAKLEAWNAARGASALFDSDDVVTSATYDLRRILAEEAARPRPWQKPGLSHDARRVLVLGIVVVAWAALVTVLGIMGVSR